MSYCSCQDRVWKGSRIVNRQLVHGSCGKVVECSICNARTAINIGDGRAECIACSPLFSDAFFDDDLDLEKAMLDFFVYHAGGVRVLDLLDKPADFENADYYFAEDDVLVELKILRNEFAQTEEHLAKFEKLMFEWLDAGKLTEQQCETGTPPPDFVEAHMRILREPIQRITNKANKQIKQTKEKLGLANARGVVLYLIDGFYQADPSQTIALIGDPLTRHMSSIEAYVVFNLRKKIKFPGETFGRFFWQPHYRNANDLRLSTFVNKLGANWFAFLQEMSGKKFADMIENEDPNDPRLSLAKFDEN